MAKRRIGEYRHRPAAVLRPGPDGQLRPTLVRRRFRYGGVVFLAYGLAGPLACAAVSAALGPSGAAELLPQPIPGARLPRAPSWENVLLGMGAPELMFASGLAGWWLWRMLWNTPVPDDLRRSGARDRLSPLLVKGLMLGPVAAGLAVPLGIFGLYLRTAPAAQPFWVRPFFAAAAALVGSPLVILTAVTPLIGLALGLGFGAATAAAVAYAWTRVPEEPVL